MAVLAECISVIVPISILEERFPGGLAGYSEAAPGSTFCHDEALTRVGFLVPDDVGHWIEVLEDFGLVFIEDGRSVDIAVVDQHQGPTLPCSWLTFGMSFTEEVSYVASAEEDPTDCEVVCPAGWTRPEPGEFSFIPKDEVADRVEVLGEEDGAVKIRDKKTGKVCFLPPGTQLPIPSGPADAGS